MLAECEKKNRHRFSWSAPYFFNIFQRIFQNFLPISSNFPIKIIDILPIMPLKLLQNVPEIEMKFLTQYFGILVSWRMISKILLCSFNELCLPDYETYEQFEQSLMLAINEGAEGFGLCWRLRNFGVRITCSAEANYQRTRPRTSRINLIFIRLLNAVVEVRSCFTYRNVYVPVFDPADVSGLMQIFAEVPRSTIRKVQTQDFRKRSYDSTALSVPQFAPFESESKTQAVPVQGIFFVDIRLDIPFGSIISLGNPWSWLLGILNLTDGKYGRLWHWLFRHLGNSDSQTGCVES